LPGAKSKRNIALRFVAGLLSLAAATVLAWEFRLHAGQFLVCSERPEKSDLILVLGGDFYGPRVLKGAELGVEGYAPQVLLSGPPYQRSRPEGEFAIDYLVSKGYPRGLFQAYGVRAGSTIPEAIADCVELKRRHIHRVILVTSSYHSRRAYIVFRLFCPAVHFIPVPAPDPHYKPDHWWTDAGSRRLFFSECKKILGSVLVMYPAHVIRSGA